jgi:hypothetical protein
MTATTKTNRGRPRKHPEGMTASQRVAASTASLKAAGGARKTFRLSPEANESLRVLMSLPDAPESETEMIERLLVDERKRVEVSCRSQQSA